MPFSWLATSFGNSIAPRSTVHPPNSCNQVKVDSMNRHKETALMLAAKAGSMPVSVYLASRGASFPASILEGEAPPWAPSLQACQLDSTLLSCLSMCRCRR